MLALGSMDIIALNISIVIISMFCYGYCYCYFGYSYFSYGGPQVAKDKTNDDMNKQTCTVQSCTYIYIQMQKGKHIHLQICTYIYIY